jgi:hypothetical protein
MRPWVQSLALANKQQQKGKVFQGNVSPVRMKLKLSLVLLGHLITYQLYVYQV